MLKARVRPWRPVPYLRSKFEHASEVDVAVPGGCAVEVPGRVAHQPSRGKRPVGFIFKVMQHCQFAGFIQLKHRAAATSAVAREISPYRRGSVQVASRVPDHGAAGEPSVLPVREVIEHRLRAGLVHLEYGAAADPVAAGKIPT